MGHGLEGDFNRKGLSAFSGRIGERVAAPGVTVVDDGTIADRRGSLNVDDEGNRPGRTVLIEDGILRGYLQDRLNAGLMKMPATGNGRREGYASIPLPRMTNTFMLAGEEDPEGIVRSVPRGLYAKHFGGGQVDITSGKFVFSATEAYLIEGGKLGAPVFGATLIGNGPDVLTKVDPHRPRPEARRGRRHLPEGRPERAGGRGPPHDPRLRDHGRGDADADRVVLDRPPVAEAPGCPGPAEDGVDGRGLDPLPAAGADEEDAPAPGLGEGAGRLQPLRVVRRAPHVDEEPVPVAEELGDVVRAPARVELQAPAVEPLRADEAQQLVLRRRRLARERGRRPARGERRPEGEDEDGHRRPRPPARAVQGQREGEDEEQQGEGEVVRPLAVLARGRPGRR